MDGNRFDDLTRRLAEDASRRSFLKRTGAAFAAIAGLGGVSTADAARRKTPTPKPVVCPNNQTWNGSACVCLDGAPPCGAECCPAGVATCCDNACCYGTCFGEERCCPTGQLVCEGVCLSPGQCCYDGDCGPGLGCLDNACVCRATTSCETAGLNCGTFTDDCGAINECGSCTEPQTCGGGGSEGVCGCISSMTCDGRCGSVPTECGSLLECGDPCAICQECQDNACVTAADNTDCGFCETCQQGECVHSEIGQACGETPGDICCPGTGKCCDMCVTVITPGQADYNWCCPANQQCGDTCCWDTDMCVDGGCYERDRVCADNVICDDSCCGSNGNGTGTCCGAGSYCVGGGCVPVNPAECTDHDSCEAIYGDGAVCAYLRPGPFGDTGTCCPNGFSRLTTSGENAGQYSCCEPNQRPYQYGCCAYPFHACDTTGTCSCSRVSVRRWGN